MAHKIPGKAEGGKISMKGNTDSQLWVQSGEEGIVLPDVEIYYKATIIKPVGY